MKTIKTEKTKSAEEKFKLKKCTIAATAETARNNYEDEPCDDNRA